ncbi:MAG: restriction endonuclease subunit S, partial [Saprospiraceae bacterium]|nr:restriction endonuclease subunit S [Saprospiraceae bacterium]
MKLTDYNKFSTIIKHVPKGWHSLKIKWALSTLESGGRQTGGGEQFSDGVFSVGGEHITWSGKLDYSNPKYIEEAYYDKMNKGKVYLNDILLVKDGATIGKCAFVDVLPFEKVAINEHVYILRSNYLSSNKYLFYFIQSYEGQEQIKLEIRGSAQGGLSNGIKNEILLPLPTIEEQTQIVKYLDYKTGLIDDFIASRKKQIELLREQKTSIINKAVTKGIDPDVKMKPSGIEWIGETPEHWEIKKIKHIKARIKNAFVDGPFGSNLKSEHFVQEGTVLVIESGFITSGEFIFSDFKKITKEHFETIKRSEAIAGDIIIAKIGFNYGMSGILPELGALSVVSGNSLKLTVNEKENISKYIHYLFLYLKKEGAFELIVNETAQPALSLTRLNNVSIAIPDREEQQQILDYLKIETSKLEDLITKYQKQIELMQEYRTAIISQAVTGKIDVREWQPKAKEL